MAKTSPHRADDDRPASGFRVVLNGTTYWLSKDEKAFLAVKAQALKILNTPQKEIEVECEKMLLDYRRAKRVFGR